jgi:RND family efflux transporter MFP subunit
MGQNHIKMKTVAISTDQNIKNKIIEMKNNKRWLGIVFFMTVLVSCAPKQAPPPPPPVPVNVQIVKEGSAVYFDLYPATVTPLNQVDIKPQVSGNITGIFFKDGQFVRKGMKLYEIDQQQYKAAYEQAVANVHVAEANESKAQQDADRYTQLSQQDAIAKQTLDHAVSDLESNKKQVEAAKANVASVETNLKYSVISAPFDGTIGISEVKIGTSVYQQTLLNTISSDDPMAVDIAIDQAEIPKFTSYLQKGTNDRDSIFTLVLPDGSIYQNPGKLILLDRAVDPQTGTIKARLVFRNKSKLLRPGITTNIRVKHNAAESSMLIPYKAVVEQLGEYFVYTVNNNRAKQHKISLGAKINANVVVKNGLNVGDSVITEGVQKLRDSVAIQVGAPKSAPSK